MILQALTQYYDVLSAENKVPQSGWGKAKVSFALGIDEQGALVNVIPLKEEEECGGKKIESSLVLNVPEQVKKSSGIASNFLCENAAYLLGCASKGNAGRIQQCFVACRLLHEEILMGIESKAAKAVLAFFENWIPMEAENHPVLAAYYEEIIAGANIVFRFAGAFVQDDEAIQHAWNNRTQNSDVVMQCLVNGNSAPIARLHSSIKGVRGAQSVGASLVSFNATAYESYEKKQSYNAPVSEQAVFAYTTTLNHLISDEKHVQWLGDATIVYWAEDGQEIYQDLFGMAAFGEESNTMGNSDLHYLVEHIIKGSDIDIEQSEIKWDNHFYVLGLAPNAARLSVRFFLQDSFGNFINKIKEHYQRLEIVKPAYEKTQYLPMWKLLRETVNPNSRDKAANPLMGGAFVRSVLTGAPYPAALLNGVHMRVRAEQNVTYGKAAIIKAYWLQNGSKTIKEVMTVSANENGDYAPYVLGRLFSVLEAVQEAANPNINATIKDKYFNSACATPAAIFPMLLKLSNSHMRKLEKGHRIFYNQQITELAGKLEGGAHGLPSRLKLEDQGAFIIGYYHQTQKRYQKKEQGGN